MQQHNCTEIRGTKEIVLKLQDFLVDFSNVQDGVAAMILKCDQIPLYDQVKVELFQSKSGGKVGYQMPDISVP